MLQCYGVTAYSRAVDLSSKTELVQVSTLLTCMGVDARRVYDTFVWENEEDVNKIECVLSMFDIHVAPLANIPFERYSFNVRSQELGESFEHYVTQLRLLSRNCDFGNITPNEILRDRIVFGMRDVRVRRKLLKRPQLTLQDVLCVVRNSSRTSMSKLCRRHLWRRVRMQFNPA